MTRQYAKNPEDRMTEDAIRNIVPDAMSDIVFNEHGQVMTVARDEAGKILSAQSAELRTLIASVTNDAESLIVSDPEEVHLINLAFCFAVAMTQRGAEAQAEMILHLFSTACLRNGQDFVNTISRRIAECGAKMDGQDIIELRNPARDRMN